VNWTEAQQSIRQRLQARDNNTLPALRRGHDLTFGEWPDFYRENFQGPIPCAEDPRDQRALKHLRRMFENTTIAELTADDIEGFLRRWLKQGVQVRTKNGFVEKDLLKATTLIRSCGCCAARWMRRSARNSVCQSMSGVEFPARVDGRFQPHYVAWSEQQKSKSAVPEYLPNVVRIVIEIGPASTRS
jgi:hypothetical protein